MVQALLALNRLAVEAAGLDLARELLRILREWAGGGARALRLHPLELLGEGTLPRGQGAQLFAHRVPGAHQRQEPLRLTVQPLLVAGEARQLLDGLGEPAPRARAAHLGAAPHQRQGRRIERVDRLVGARRGFGPVWVRFLELGAGPCHLPFRVPEGRFELGRHERVLAGGFADLARDGVRASSTDPCWARVAALTSPPRSASATCCCRSARAAVSNSARSRSEEHTSELQSHLNLVCRLLLEKKKQTSKTATLTTL